MTASPGTSDNHRLTVALTFDFDAESVWLYDIKSASPSTVSRGTYGALEGIPRILRLLSKYDLPSTFFVPGYTADYHPDVVRSIAAAGHEIGHHGYLHEPPNLISPDEERVVIERGLEALERVVGERPHGFRSPSAELSSATCSLLTEYGFDYDSSQFGADRPYWVEDNGERTKLVEIPIAIELTDSCHFMFLISPVAFPGLSAPSKVEEIWRGDFDGLYEEDSDACYVLTMHPQITGRPHRLRMVERIIQHMLEYEGVWFARMSDISANFRQKQGLVDKKALS